MFIVAIFPLSRLFFQILKELRPCVALILRPKYVKVYSLYIYPLTHFL